MAGVFSALCITSKALSLCKVCKDCLQAVAIASAFAKIRLFDKQINLELEGTSEFAQSDLSTFCFFKQRRKLQLRKEARIIQVTHSDLAALGLGREHELGSPPCTATGESYLLERSPKLSFNPRPHASSFPELSAPTSLQLLALHEENWE